MTRLNGRVTRLEKKVNERKINRRWNGIRVFWAVKRLQERNPGKKISFHEIYEEINTEFEMSMKTVAKNLYRWVHIPLLESTRGKLLVFEPDGNYLDKYNNEDAVKLEKIKYNYMFKWAKDGTTYGEWDLYSKEMSELEEDINVDERMEKSSQEGTSEKKSILKTEMGEYTELIAKTLKEHKGYIGNGADITKIMNDYAQQYCYIDTEDIAKIDNKTILRNVENMLNYHNSKECDALGIRICIEVERTKEEQENDEKEFRVVQYNPDVVAEEENFFENKLKNEEGENVKIIRKEAKLRAFDISQVWGEMEQSWYGKDAATYWHFFKNISEVINEKKENELMVEEEISLFHSSLETEEMTKEEIEQNVKEYRSFCENRMQEINEKKENEVIVKEIVKVLRSNPTNEEMTNEEIKQKLEEYIPATYRAKKVFKEGLSLAIRNARKKCKEEYSEQMNG